MAGASRPASEASVGAVTGWAIRAGGAPRKPIRDCPADGGARESPRPSDVRPSQRRGSGRQRRSGMIGRDRQGRQGCGTITAIDGSEQGARSVMSELSADQTRLAQIWEEHMRHEFQTCSTEDTLATMVEDAYVNHVPIMTGGVGHAELRQFYATHFIPKMPPDMEMTPLSRTIGTDQLVDEMVV